MRTAQTSPMKTTRYLAVAICLCVITPPPTGCAENPRLENFDRRAEISPPRRAWTEAQKSALNRLERQAPGLNAEIHPIFGGPQWLGAGDGILADRTSKVGFSDEEAGARSFVASNVDLFGFNEDALDGARETKNDMNPKTGLKTVVWQQEALGLPVIGAALKANFNGQGGLIAVSGGLLPHQVLAALAAPVAPALDAPRAVAAASAAIEAPSLPAEIVEDAAAAKDGARFFRSPSLRTARARLVWLPMSPSDIRLCWLTRVEGRRSRRAYEITVDAGTGEMLVRANAVAEQAQATYRVYASDSPRPMSPGLAAPANTQADVVLTQTLTLRALDLTASPNGWVTDMDNPFQNHFTLGNNCYSGWDREADQTVQIPGAGTGLAFDWTPNLTLDPGNTNNQQASAINAFYWVNWMHDRMYQLGFTETAGNFQEDNFGRGGLQGDRVQVQTQYGIDANPSLANNAFFIADVDGNPVGLELRIFTAPDPDRDSAFDNETILHEYGHGVSRRTVGTGTILPLNSVQAKGLGEGWSDFLALSLLSNAGDAVDGNYAFGAYLAQDYYYGLRRFPYSTETAKNPLLFRNLWSATFAYTATLSPAFSSPTDPKEEHNAGEVWCNSLWGARARIIGKHGHAIGNNRMLVATLGGMNLLPDEPTYVAARQTFVQAYETAFGIEDRAELWYGFAKRGLGYNAESPNAGLSDTGKESYQLQSESLDGGSALADGANATCVDANGAYYTAGYRTSATTGKDVLVMRHDAFGRKQWDFAWSGTATNKPDEAVAIAESGGSLYVAVSSSNGTNQDFVVLKLVASTGLLDTSWVSSGSGTGVRRYDQVVSSVSKNNAPTAMVVSGGSIYLTGYGQNSTGYEVYLTVKWDTAGNLKWAAPPTYNSTAMWAWSKASAITVLGSTVAITGTSFQSSTVHDYATIRYTDNGTTVTENWVRRYNNTTANNSDWANAIAIETSGIYVAGDSIGADSPNYDVAVLRYTNNSTGTQSWVRRYDVAGVSGEGANSIQADATSVYVLGTQDATGGTSDGILMLKLAAGTGALSSSWLDSGDGIGVRVFQKGLVYTAWGGVALSPIASRIRVLARVNNRPWLGEIQAADGNLRAAELFQASGVIPKALAVAPNGNVNIAGIDAFNSSDTQFSTTLVLDGLD